MATQIYWETAPWRILEAYLTSNLWTVDTAYSADVYMFWPTLHDKCYHCIQPHTSSEEITPNNPDYWECCGYLELNHNFLEDIRKRMFIWEFPEAGADTSEEYYSGYEYHPIPLEDPTGAIYYYKGQWWVTWEDPNYGWQWWYNNKDLSEIEVGEDVPPPASIHPADNEWVTSNSRWQLMADKNKYHHWDKNAPHKYIVESSVGSEETEDLLISMSEGFAYLWLPRQTDPKEQLTPINYLDMGKPGWQYKSKVEIKRKHFTQLDTLGPVWDCWRYRQLGTGDPPSTAIVPGDPWGWMPEGSLPGYQYANSGGVEINTPGFGSGDGGYPDRMPLSKAYELEGIYLEWRWNPKVNWAYQNRVEVLLDGLSGRHPADSTYTANFHVVYGEDDEDTYPEWQSHPEGTDDLWGENESGIELCFKIRGEYDWYFDYTFPYYPKNVVEAATDDLLNNEMTYAEVLEKYDLGGDGPARYGFASSPAGTWRRTWKYTMGRISPYIRSKEMGEPSRRDSWSGYGRWFGARSIHYPAISEFDNKFETIIDTIDAYTFTVSGNITDDLKPHWMIHLATSQSQKIYEDSAWIPYAYVIRVEYDSGTNKTIVKISQPHTGYTLLCWNKEISERHDASQIAWMKEGESWVAYPEYENAAWIIWEIREMLKIPKYREVYVTISGTAAGWSGGAESTYTSANEVFSEGATNLWTSYEPDPDDWGGVTIAGASATSGAEGMKTYFDDEYEWYFGLSTLGSVVHYWNESALQITGTRAAIAALHGKLLVRFVYDGCPPPGEPSEPWGPYGRRPASVGVGSVIISQPVEDPIDYHYRFISLPVVKYGSKKWIKIRLRGGLPNCVAVRNFNDYGGPYWCQEGGIRTIEMNLEADIPCVEVDLENVPASVFERCTIGHVDIPETPILDIEPPRPNPPLHHNTPQAYFKHIPGITGTYYPWDSETEYEIDDIVVWPEVGDTFYKCLIACQGISPENETYWEKHAYYFELRISGDSGLCIDYEGSDPVKYRAVEENDNIITDWSTSRYYDALVRTMSIREGIGVEQDVERDLDNEPTSNPSGTRTRLTYQYADELEVGTEVTIDDSLNGDFYIDGEWVVIEVGEGWFDIDTGYFQDGTPAEGATIAYTFRDPYDEEEWDEEPCKDWMFKLQAKDSASPQNNLTDFSELKPVATPTEWPTEVYETYIWQPP